jgi:hypothetical protein
MFSGATEYRCRTTDYPFPSGIWPINPNYQFLCGYVPCPLYEETM